VQTLNITFHNNKDLISFIENNKICSKKNILIQLFSGVIDEDKVLNITTLLKEKLPQANIIGSTTAGEIVDGKMYEGTILISFSIFNSTKIKSKLFKFEDKFNVNHVIDSLIVENTKALIIFSDGLKSNAENLLKSITALNPDLIIAGGRAADTIRFKRTFVFDHETYSENGFIIASLSGDDLIVNNDYMFNWRPIGKEMTVTHSDGNIVYDVDNIRIKDLYKKYLGPEISENLPWVGAEFPLLTTRNGIKVARSPIAIQEDGSFLFGGNLITGEKVKFAYGNVNDIKSSIYDNSKRISKLPIESIFIYSCSGRKTLMGKDLEIEFNMLNSLATTTGFFTYGEYFHSERINEILNITTTFITLSEDKNKVKKDLKAVKLSSDNRVLKALTNLLNVTTKEIEYKNKELTRLNNMISKSVLYSTSDLNGNITTISKAYLEFLNLSYEDVIGKNHSIFQHPDTPQKFYHKMWACLNNNIRFIDDLKNKRPDGSEYWLRIMIDPIFDENNVKIGYSSYREDVTDKKVLEYTSSHDSLTELYNRGEFTKRLKHKIKLAQAYNIPFGFAIFDIDHFKKVNDTYGHKVGDDVLIKIAKCLKKNVIGKDFVARWGGEEFVIITHSKDIDTLISLVEQIQDEISKISFTPVPKVTISFGLTIYRKDESKQSMIKRADKALYMAKDNGRDQYKVLL